MSEETGAPRPSKSARKREIAAMQALADRMAALSDDELQRLGVDENLRAALELVRPMRPSGARNRQLKYCVRFMDLQALSEVQAYIEDQHSQRVELNRRFDEIERWRDRLIAEGDAGLKVLFDTYEGLDRQHVRRLCRDASREKDSGKPAGAGRRLYRYLREFLPVSN